ncbi:hypothetical protein [uncultured Anaerococcus sp.]|uniref:hypothetical protein n=1 Tax=uncultured Anaerococcus sp. TaxID=293428 RepID=UPI0025FFCCFD|nr:hypothetical protein [uncultured Anaerococcus sp.]
MSKYLDIPGLNYLIKLIKDKFVQKENGKGLSSQDYTLAEKQKLENLKAYSVASGTDAGLMSTSDFKKLAGISAGANKNVISKVKRNGSLVNVSSETVDISVPTKVSDLVDDKDLISTSQVRKLISEASHMKKEVVAQRPTSGEENVIYLVGPKGSGSDIYEEWLWINSKWEKVGNTATSVDLSGYIKKSDISAITTTEINQAMGV